MQDLETRFKKSWTFNLSARFFEACVVQVPDVRAKLRRLSRAKVFTKFTNGLLRKAKNLTWLRAESKFCNVQLFYIKIIISLI